MAMVALLASLGRHRGGDAQARLWGWYHERGVRGLLHDGLYRHEQYLPGAVLRCVLPSARQFDDEIAAEITTDLASSYAVTNNP
jgi:hypothetical protein